MWISITKWKTTSPKIEDDLTQNGIRLYPKWKTTKNEDNQKQRRPKTKTTQNEDDQKRVDDQNNLLFASNDDPSEIQILPFA